MILLYKFVFRGEIPDRITVSFTASAFAVLMLLMTMAWLNIFSFLRDGSLVSPIQAAHLLLLLFTH